MRTVSARLAMVVCLAAVTLSAGMQSCADDPRSAAVVTVKTGALTVELSQAASWTIRSILYRGAALGTATGAYGAALNIPVIGGWIGSAHSQGGIEDIQELALIVDGEPAELTDGAVYPCQRAELTKRAMLDKVRLEATTTFENERVIEHHVLTAAETVVVRRVYPFMHCLTSATTEWMALTYDGLLKSGSFAESNRLDWHTGWQWTAAFDPVSCKGFLLRFLQMPQEVEAQAGYWPQDRYHKLYVQLMTGNTVQEGTVLDCKCVVTCFEAPAAAWQEGAREVAQELAAQ